MVSFGKPAIHIATKEELDKYWAKAQEELAKKNKKQNKQKTASKK